MVARNVPTVNPDDTLVWVIVINTGSGRTTITNLGFFYFETEPNKDITKSDPKQRAIVMSPGIGTAGVPYALESGGQWDGFARQDQEFVKQAKTGYLYAVVYHTMAEKPIFARVVFDKDKKIIRYFLESIHVFQHYTETFCFLFVISIMIVSMNAHPNSAG